MDQRTSPPQALNTVSPSTHDDIRFVFRFRDLIAETLKEHQEIIRQYGKCWWGWWKRPSEDARTDVWLRLQNETQQGNQLTVGLFDSGSGNVFAAKVDAVEIPKESATPPVLAVPERKLVPAYYRNSPFSRGWMRLTEINPAPLSFFDNYSFDEVPPLHGYAPDVLARLRGKVIKSAAELRGMDTTIWIVRKRQANDLDQEIILSTGNIGSPISRQATELKSDLILHLSDPHFVSPTKNRNQHVWRLEGESGETATLADAIKRAIGDQPVGLVIVTGDLTFTGSEEEFHSAATSLNKLSGLLDLDSDRFIIIPGNHDIQWTKDDQYNESSPVTEAPDLAKQNYRSFYNQFFRHTAHPMLAMGRRFVLPSGVVLEICGLNSSSLATGRNFLAGMGRIDENTYRSVANELKWSDPPQGLAVRFLAIHHHLSFTEDVEGHSGYSTGFGIAVDAPRILRLAARNGVHLALHGHKHRAFLWRSDVYELPEMASTRFDLGPFAILGVGSSGSSDTPTKANFFNLIRLTAEGMNVAMYKAANAGTFEPVSKWTADLELKSEHNRIALGKWQEVK